jgi:DNA repair exonuclease SbcCD ATPase subunit
VDETSLDDLRRELATLEATETKISAERRRLHNQIDYGYANEDTRAREREISDQRRQLHRRIDSLRELLQAQEEPIASPEQLRSRLSEWSGITPEAAPVDGPGEDDFGL